MCRLRTPGPPAAAVSLDRTSMRPNPPHSQVTTDELLGGRGAVLLARLRPLRLILINMEKKVVIYRVEHRTTSRPALADPQPQVALLRLPVGLLGTLDQVGLERLALALRTAIKLAEMREAECFFVERDRSSSETLRTHLEKTGHGRWAAYRGLVEDHLDEMLSKAAGLPRFAFLDLKVTGLESAPHRP
jgi:hypothetical protein